MNDQINLRKDIRTRNEQANVYANENIIHTCRTSGYISSRLSYMVVRVGHLTQTERSISWIHITKNEEVLRHMGEQKEELLLKINQRKTYYKSRINMNFKIRV